MIYHDDTRYVRVFTNISRMSLRGETEAGREFSRRTIAIRGVSPAIAAHGEDILRSPVALLPGLFELLDEVKQLGPDVGTLILVFESADAEFGIPGSWKTMTELVHLGIQLRNLDKVILFSEQGHSPICGLFAQISKGTTLPHTTNVIVRGNFSLKICAAMLKAA